MGAVPAHFQKLQATTTMKTTSTNRRMSAAGLVLADPTIQSYLAKCHELDEQSAARERAKDVEALQRLLNLMTGRTIRPVRTPRLRSLYGNEAPRRDPRDVAWHYLRRVRGGTWYRGGSHVARLNYGPGIAFMFTPGKGISIGLINAGGVA